jgi:hypothetical protein
MPWNWSACGFDHGFKILAANKSALVIQCFQMYSCFMSNSDVFVLLSIADMQII